MSNMQDFKCMVCGGTVEFDSASQKMKCPFCDSIFDMSDFQQPGAAQQQEVTGGFVNEAAGWSQGEQNGMAVYQCRSCGGEIVGDQNLGATKCPYCDNQVVMTGMFQGDLRPEFIIPFKLDKNAAKNKYLQHLEGKKFLPKVFKDQNHIDEIKGIYVPYWLFDAQVEGNIAYEGTRVKTWNDAQFNYKETSYFNIIRGGSIDFDKVPADGSSKMDDTLMESIEPFNVNEAVPFNTAYLAGYLAEKYDVTAEQNQQHVYQRMEESVVENFRKTIQNYDSVKMISKRFNIVNGKTHYVLYPVWLLNTTWNGQKFVFAMNGQTGKLVGDLPMDKGEYWKTFFTVTSIATVIAGIILYFMMMR